MILFKAIRYRNFLSSGNLFTEINLNSNKTTLIVGSNGSGKSTLLDALCFCLFNKAFRKISKSQLVNSTNEKDCVVEVEFSIGKTDWKITRGIKPNIFEIRKNNKLLDQLSSTVDQQKWLEDTVLKLNFKSFTQIVILGSASFVPFMQLSSSHRREIVEDLLDIKIFSSMNSIVKDKIRNSVERERELSSTKEVLQEKVKIQKRFLNLIEQEGKEKIEQKTQKIETIKSSLKILSEKNEENLNIIQNQLNPQLSEVSKSSKKIKELNNIRGKIQQKISSIEEQSDFFQNNHVCPTCTQKINDEFREDKIGDYSNKLKELESGFLELNETIKKEEDRERKFNELSKEVVNLNSQISNNNTKIFHLESEITDIKEEIEDILNKIKNKNNEKENIKKIEQQIKETENEYSKIKDQVKYLQFANHLLKDGGIKAKVIKKYLPLMNQQINKYLQLMDFYINFTLDEEFKEKIKSPIYEDFTYESFSEGEKMRINLALLFTWREIAKMKNSVNTNILILDEVFDSSLDEFGTDYFSKIIRFVIKDSNVFVISHKTDELIDKFDKIIKFSKVKGFSKISD